MPPKKKKEEEKTKPEKQSFLRFLLSLNPSRVQLEFGINENCRLIKVDNTERKREGEVVKRNTFLTFAKFNTKGEIIGQTEFNYFNLDPNSEYILESLVTQMSQLAHIISLLNPTKFDSFNPVAEYETEAELLKALSSEKSCKELQENMYEQFNELVKDFVSNDGPLLAVKIVTDNKGKYLQLPKEAKFCALMSGDFSFLKITPYEMKIKEKGLSPSVATPDKPDTKSVKSNSTDKILKI